MLLQLCTIFHHCYWSLRPSSLSLTLFLHPYKFFNQWATSKECKKPWSSESERKGERVYRGEDWGWRFWTNPVSGHSQSQSGFVSLLDKKRRNKIQLSQKWLQIVKVSVWWGTALNKYPVNAAQKSACAILCSAAMNSGHKMHNVK